MFASHSHTATGNTYYEYTYLYKVGFDLPDGVSKVTLPDDPAIPVVEKLRGRYPAVPSRLIVTGASSWPNLKDYSLERMLAFCRSGGTILVTGRWPERAYRDPSDGSKGRGQALLHELTGGIGEPAQVTSRSVGRG